MAPQNFKPEEIVELAVSAVNAEGSVDDRVEALESYFDAFTEWFEDNQETIQNNPQEIGEEVLSLLNEKHTFVLKFAEKLAVEAKKDLIKHQAHGRGIMAYTDILPKAIRVTKKRKG